MQQVNVGIVGLGNIGGGTMTILAENAGQIALKLGFRLVVKIVSSLDADTRVLPEALGPVERTLDWRRVATLIHVSRGLDALEEAVLVPERKIFYQFSARGHDLAQDREAAEAGIEDKDGGVGRHGRDSS